MTLLLIVLLPFVGAVLSAFFVRLSRNAAAWAAGVVTASSLALLLRSAPPVFDGEVLSVTRPWMPLLGLNLSLRLDGLGLLFALLVLGLGLLVILYARYYLYKGDPMGRFYAFLLLFMGSMLGVVLSGNVLLLVVFWEMTSLTSFLLIGYWRQRSEARQGARMALVVTSAGGLAMMAGFLLLGRVAGSFELSVILDSAHTVQSHALYTPILLLILLGAFTKSAQAPFHFWLPYAMAAPTPVSAYLHSATMVKAGVFLLARLYPDLSGTDLWFYLVSGAGLASLLLGAYTALFKHDLKGLLAYSTISHLGLITLLLGLGTPAAPVAGVFHIINHAIFKASLFMAVGIIDHQVGTRDMRLLSGLWRYMPYTAALAMVSAAAMAGVPLLNGFLSKEMFYAEVVERTVVDERSWLVPILVTVAGIFSVAYSVRFIHDVFFGGEPTHLPRAPHPPPGWIRVPVEILVALCLLVGIFPEHVVGRLLDTASRAALGRPAPEYHLTVWHGFNVPVIMSTLALTGGALMYYRRKVLFDVHGWVFSALAVRRVYDEFILFSQRMSERITRGLENGSLQRYMLLLIVSTLVLGAAPFLRSGGVTGNVPLSPPDVESLLMLTALAVAALSSTLLHRRRLAAVVVLSVVGLLIAITFIRFSAPDLALTQLAVEVVTIILLLLVLYYLPQTTPAEGSRIRRWRDTAIAVSAGLGSACLVWAVLTRPFSGISDFYLEKSLPEGGGTNVVNVILVDFRGFDTLGEISVLAVAALSIYAMIKGLRLTPPATGHDNRPWAEDRYPLILVVITRALLPMALLVSVYMFLRGHNQPGGGFVAGLITGVALILQYFASGVRWTQQRLKLQYHFLIAAGVSLALLTGWVPWIFDARFLTSAFGHVHLPVVGEFELASAMVFDLGVYLTVVGTVMLILANLGRVSGGSSVDVHAIGEETKSWKP